jgi:hypothetical protein
LSEPVKKVRLVSNKSLYLDLDIALS